MAKISKAAKTSSFWLISDFRVPSSGISKLRALTIHKLMYASFQTVTGVSARRIGLPDEAMQHGGFVRLAQNTLDWGLLASELWGRDCRNEQGCAIDWSAATMTAQAFAERVANGKRIRSVQDLWRRA